MKRNVYVDFSYLTLISITLGAVIVLGAFVAPVIFNTDTLLHTVVLDRYNAGIVMGEIFYRFSYWLYIVAFFILFYELVMYKMGQRDIVIFVSSITAVFSALMFSAVYVPKIVDMHALGVDALKSDTFQNIHVASELDFKILAVALLILFIRRLMLLRIK